MALLEDLSGPLGSTFAPVKSGIQAFVSYYNARGGIYGHHLDFVAYDDASDPAQTLQNARLAVANGAQVLVSQETLLTSAVPYIESTKIPIFGFGSTPDFFGADKTTFFSYPGNLITAASNAAFKYAIQQMHLTRTAIVSDPNPTLAVAVQPLKVETEQLGGTVSYMNVGVDDTNSGAILALAEKLKSTPTQLVYANFLGYASAQLQADLNQVGSKIVVLTGFVGFDPQVPKQFGSAANGFMGTMLSATWLSPTIPGIQTYMTAMSQYQPSEEYVDNALYGWDAMVELGGALQALGSQAPTPANIAVAANSLHGFTGDGILQPVSFPAFHTEPALCVDLGQLQNGVWKNLTGTASSPFFCGDKVG